MKLSFGDCCFVSRDDGGFVPYIYLLPVKRSRSYFYGALGVAIVDTPSVDQLPELLPVSDYALTHVHCFKKNSTPIVGNLSDRLEEGLRADVSSTVYETDVGASHLVWGHRTIIKRANMIVAQ